MKKLTIIGLGPGNLNDMTVRAKDLLENQRVILRTAKHPCIKELEKQGYTFETFDNYYETGENFEEVYQNIVNNLIEKVNNESSVYYAVPGNPMFNEKTVELLIDKVEELGIELEIVPGVSYIDSVANTLRCDLANETVITDSYSILDNDVIFNPNLNYVINEVWSKYYLSELKLKAMEIYPDDQDITIVNHAGLEDETIINIKLYELDHYDVDYLSTLYIPKNSNLNRSFDNIVKVTSYLRSEDGCPWDRAQTHNSLKRYLIEETAEAIDALDREDYDNLKEELGDVLFEITLHSQIADENNEFSIFDVIESITDKMIRRHPHIFSNAQFDSQEEFVKEWDKIKQIEKNKKLTVSEEMREIPYSLSALLTSDKIQHKAKKVGFDWDNPMPALDKVLEEAAEVKEVMELTKNEEDLKEELGDLIFAVVNVIRLCDYDPEEILRFANNKFINRFSKMEDQAEKLNKKLEDMNLEEQEELWQNSKHESV